MFLVCQWQEKGRRKITPFFVGRTGLPWGDDFKYDEAILNKSKTQARIVGLASGADMLTAAFTPTRKLAARFLPQPGEGPNQEQREAGFYELHFHGVHPGDRACDMRLSVRGELDPGYGSTARMLGEAAMCLAKDSAITKGGFWTPASALGQAYLERLEQFAGLSFSELDV